jgi:hypothetical protein
MPKEMFMKTKVGLWVDHEKAVVLALTPRGEEILSIKSEVEKQQGRLAGIRSTAPYEALQKQADDSRQRRLTGQLNIYYDAVIAGLRKAEAILILGPSEAKGEIKKRLEKEGLGERIVAVETTGFLTDRQIYAKIREYFRDNHGLNQSRRKSAKVPGTRNNQASLKRSPKGRQNKAS